MTQELRIQGTAFNDKLDWLIGGFYGDEDITANQTMTLNADFQKTNSAFNFGSVAGVNPLFALTALGNAGVPVNANGNYAENRFLQNAKSWSVFTHNVVNITEKLSLTLGARYVKEEKDASFDQLGATTGAGAGATAATGATCAATTFATTGVAATDLAESTVAWLIPTGFSGCLGASAVSAGRKASIRSKTISKPPRGSGANGRSRRPIRPIW